MGLQEKRAIQNIKDNYFGDYQKKLNEIAGKELPYDINWDSFDMNSINMIPNVCLERILDAIKGICSDQLGKDAIAESLDKIVVNNIDVKDAENSKSMSFENKTLTINAGYGGSLRGCYTDTAMKEFLEDNL